MHLREKTSLSNCKIVQYSQSFKLHKMCDVLIPPYCFGAQNTLNSNEHFIYETGS